MMCLIIQSRIVMSKETKRKKSLPSSSLIKYSVGIDIGKKNYHVCLSSIDTQQNVKVISTTKFNNTLKGNESFIKWVNNKIKHDLPLFYAMEATGVYYEKLAWFLHKRGDNVSVVLPNKSKKYIESIGQKSKNDKIDSIGLSRMCSEQKLELWDAPDENILRLRNITRQRESLQEMRTSIINQLEAYNSSEVTSPEVKRQLTDLLNTLNSKVLETEEFISKVIESDKDLNSKIGNITEVKGLALVTVATVIAETNGFKLFNNSRQLVSYSGYDIIENQSGNHVGRTKISKRGNSHIRRILHMASLNVVRFDEPVFRNLYERVFERTKIKMKGYVAVQRKILVLVYTLWNKDEKYDRNYLKNIAV